jgi:hypothetical protein
VLAPPVLVRLYGSGGQDSSGAPNLELAEP